MNETVIWKIFFPPQKESKDNWGRGKLAVWKGKTPVADCAPAGQRRGRTTPLGALSSAEKDEPSITCWRLDLFSPSLASFLGLSVPRDGLTFWIITMVTHFHQEDGHIHD